MPGTCRFCSGIYQENPTGRIGRLWPMYTMCAEFTSWLAWASALGLARLRTSRLKSTINEAICKAFWKTLCETLQESAKIGKTSALGTQEIAREFCTEGDRCPEWIHINLHINLSPKAMRLAALFKRHSDSGGIKELETGVGGSVVECGYDNENAF